LRDRLQHVNRPVTNLPEKSKSKNKKDDSDAA